MFDTALFGLFPLFAVFSIQSKAEGLGTFVASPKEKLNRIHAYRSGNYILGGLFPVHTNIIMENKSVCINLNDKGVAWVEGMIYAVQKLSDSHLFPNITLGYYIHDDCNSIARAMESALEFISGYQWKQSGGVKSNKANYFNLKDETEKININSSNDFFRKDSPSVVAVIGPASSTVALSTADVLGTNFLPQVSYSATSQLLSDKTQYRSFLRTIPSDVQQVKAMVDIMVYLKWTYVSVIGSDDVYGRFGITTFEDEAEKRNICIAVRETFGPSTSQESLRETIRKLKTKKKSKVILIFASYYQIKSVLMFTFDNGDHLGTCGFSQEIQAHHLYGKILFSSESWADNRHLLQMDPALMEGTIGLVPYKGMTEDYEAYLRQRTLEQTLQTNPWFAEFLEENYCTLSANDRNDWMKKESQTASVLDDISTLPKTKVPKVHMNSSITFCLKAFSKETTLGELFPGNVLPLGKVAYVIDAVYTVGYALKELLCNHTTGVKSKIINKDLLQLMKNGTFNGTQGQVSFDKNGDAYANYSILNIQRNENGSLYYKTVGYWSLETLHLKTDEMMWNGGSKVIPLSRCSKNCKAGTRIIFGLKRCCWTCIRCSPGLFTNSTNMVDCLNCSEIFGGGWINNSDNSGCFLLPLEYLSWSDSIASAALLLSFFFVIITCVIFGLLVKYQDTPVIKGSNRNLMYILLIILVFSFLSPYVYIGEPNDVLCKIQPNYLGFIFTTCLTVVLLKTKRILNVFNAKLTKIENIRSERQKREHIQMLILASVEVAELGVMGLATYLHPPVVEYDYSYNDRTIKSCGKNWMFLHVIALGIFGILSLVCIILAFKARKLPENFNEARYISFTTFLIFLIWAGCLPGFFGSVGKMPAAYMCYSVMLKGMSILVFMIFPKLKVIAFYPEKNTPEAVRSQTITHILGKKSLQVEPSVTSSSSQLYIYNQEISTDQ